MIIDFFGRASGDYAIVISRILIMAPYGSSSSHLVPSTLIVGQVTRGVLLSRRTNPSSYIINSQSQLISSSVGCLGLQQSRL